MTKVYRTGNYPPHYGYTDPDEDPETETGKAEKFEDFDEQIDALSSEQWEKLTELLHVTTCPKIVEFLEGLALPVSYDEGIRR